MKKIYMIAGGGLALVLIISVIVIVVSLNYGNKGQKPGTEQTQEQTNEAVSSQGKKDETEIIGDDTSLPGETDTDREDTNKTDTDKMEDKGNGDQPGGEEQAGNGDQPGSEEQPEGGDQPEGPVELPFVPYS